MSNPAIPSPRQGECKPGSLLERDPVAYFKLKHRNVDKQRRRLLADRLFQESEFFEAMAYTHRIEPADETRAAWCDARASKLRTIAARLRGTK